MKAFKKNKMFYVLSGILILPALFFPPHNGKSAFGDGIHAAGTGTPGTPKQSSEGSGHGKRGSDGSDSIGHGSWEHLKCIVHKTAGCYSVGKKFLEAYGPLGKGEQCVPFDTYDIPSWANIDMLGEANDPVHPLKRAIIPIPLIYKDFWIFWRDVEESRECHERLDVSAAVAAASAAAIREDDLIFNGSDEMGMTGLLNAEGRNTLKLSDWTVIGNGFQDIVSATEKLRSSGFHGPYTLIVNPKLYALLHKVYERTGELEIEGVKKLVSGVYQCAVIKKDVALVVANSRQYMDLAVGTDFRLEYWGEQDLNHRFRVVGSSVLRVKTPQAICTLE
ncbi:MAG: bacteriocin family protein [Candidatus Kuenenia sp.]|nr:bacteriocin family protein [Candidatus Kuenenia hertensis]